MQTYKYELDNKHFIYINNGSYSLHKYVEMPPGIKDDVVLYSIHCNLYQSRVFLNYPLGGGKRYTSIKTFLPTVRQSFCSCGGTGRRA